MWLVAGSRAQRDRLPFELRKTKSTAALMTSSSGTEPNIIVGHATTPASMEIAASNSEPLKISASMPRIGF
jgi:hypothetical protein